MPFTQRRKLTCFCRSTYAVLLVSVVLLLCYPLSIRAQSSNVEKAVDFLKAACVTSGSSLDIQVRGDGSLQVLRVGSGVKGSITLTKKELEGFADAASALSAQQASEMRNCMKPYIDRILAAMLTGQATNGPLTYPINTQGHYFKTHEFDKVIAVAAASPYRITALETIVEKSRLSYAKVFLYLEIAAENGMGNFDKSVNHQIAYGNRNGPHYKVNETYDIFSIERKGLSYALSKGLVD